MILNHLVLPLNRNVLHSTVSVNRDIHYTSSRASNHSFLFQGIHQSIQRRHSLRKLVTVHFPRLHFEETTTGKRVETANELRHAQHLPQTPRFTNFNSSGGSQSRSLLLASSTYVPSAREKRIQLRLCLSHLHTNFQATGKAASSHILRRTGPHMG
eukprot:gb/GECG01001587.1/.p1 GENE.gb/GECG01001587.1/~~gb/GECG01001587.1/.p1  ORF type:complete len:156 (+),score=5.26 gb/GECG01001587.1/:1-468(+)